MQRGVTPDLASNATPARAGRTSTPLCRAEVVGAASPGPQALGDNSGREWEQIAPMVRKLTS
jgi:hypothetical protein